MSRFPFILLLASSCLSAPALALIVGGAADEGDAVKLAALDMADPIIVIGQRGGYDAKRSSTATKTDTDLKDVPQAVSVITSEQVADQAMRSVADVLRYVPGVSLSGGEGHRDQIAIRGNVSTADFFVDGLRDDVQYYRGLYNLDRIEVLKGPNALIFGRGGGGGVVNRVTKRAEATRFARGAASVDSYGAWYVEGDVNAPLAGGVDGRLNAVYEEFDNFRDVYEGHRIGVNPTIGFTPGDRTRIDVGFEYARDERVIDRGVPSQNGRPLDGYDQSFFGQRGVNVSKFIGRVATARVEHRFNDTLKLQSKALYGDYDKLYQNAFAAGPVSAGQVAIEAYRDPTSRTNLLIQNDLIAEAQTGPVGHTILVGMDYADQRTRNQRINGFFDSGVPTTNSGRRTLVVLADEIVIPAITFRAGSGNRSTKTHGQAFGLYVQDQARIGAHVEIVAGLRRDWFNLDVTNRLTGVTFEREDALWSPRLGVVVKPTDAVSLYASVSRSFLPQSGDQFSSLDVTLAALKPERFTNLEIGAKWRVVAAFDVTLAAYRLDRTNTREVDPITLQTLLTGEQRSKGIELTAQGRPLANLSVSGGFALQDVEIRRSSTPALVGRRAPLVPKFQASAWARYDFTARIGAGLGVYHQSNSFASISNAVVLPAFTRVDAAGYFKVTEQVELAVNVENLLDRDYTGVAFNDNNLTPANPRTVRATLRFGI
ncbi:MAG: TonB-dependent siderophore receptor [Sphingomicrobium sp.]